MGEFFFLRPATFPSREMTFDLPAANRLKIPAPFGSQATSSRYLLCARHLPWALRLAVWRFLGRGRAHCTSVSIARHCTQSNILNLWLIVGLTHHRSLSLASPTQSASSQVHKYNPSGLQSHCSLSVILTAPQRSLSWPQRRVSTKGRLEFSRTILKTFVGSLLV